MGKAKRVRDRRAEAPVRDGKQVFPGFPYDRQFTEAELEVIFARWERLKETLRDVVGPQGWGIGLPEDVLQQIALHQALTGEGGTSADYPPFDPDTGRGSFIRPVRNHDGLYVDSITWVLTKRDKPGDRARDAQAEARARMDAAFKAANQNASDEVRAEIAALFGRGAAWAEQQHEPTTDPEPLAPRGEHP